MYRLSCFSLAPYDRWLSAVLGVKAENYHLLGRENRSKSINEGIAGYDLVITQNPTGIFVRTLKIKT